MLRASDDGVLMQTVTLEDDRSRAVIVPDLGGGLASFDAKTTAGAVPILRPLADGRSDPFDMACNLMAPFANRISGGGFMFDGVFHPVESNLPDREALPLHGDALQRIWTVAECDERRAVLTLDHGAIGPWRYAARMEWRLDAGALHAVLELTNTGPRLPFGGGFHPWLQRSDTTRLQFAARSVWLAGDDKLPTAKIPLEERPDWDFRKAQDLPGSPIDNCFAGWNGTARVTQPDLGIDVVIRSGGRLDHLMVFSPGAGADIVCVEPVSHAVDAINAPGHPGMITLAPGDGLGWEMVIDWRPHR